MNDYVETVPNLSFISTGFNIEIPKKPDKLGKDINLENNNLNSGIKFGLQTKDSLQKRKLDIFEDEEVNSISPVVSQKRKLPNMSEMFTNKTKIFKESETVTKEKEAQNVDRSHRKSDKIPASNRHSSPIRKEDQNRSDKRDKNRLFKPDVKRHSSKDNRDRSRDRNHNHYKENFNRRSDDRWKQSDKNRYNRDRSETFHHPGTSHRRLRYSDPKHCRPRQYSPLADRKRLSDSHRYKNRSQINEKSEFVRPRTPHDSERRKDKSPIGRERSQEKIRSKPPIDIDQSIHSKINGNSDNNNNYIEQSIKSIKPNSISQPRKNYRSKQISDFEKSQITSVESGDPEPVEKIFSQIRDHKVIRKIDINPIEPSNLSNPPVDLRDKIDQSTESINHKSIGKVLKLDNSKESIDDGRSSASSDNEDDDDNDDNESWDSDRTTSMRLGDRIDIDDPVVTEPINKWFSRGYPLVCEIYSDDEDLADLDVGMLTSIPHSFRRTLIDKFQSINNQSFLIQLQQIIYEALKRDLPGVSFNSHKWRFDFNMRLMPDCLVLGIEQLVIDFLNQQTSAHNQSAFFAS